VPTKTTHILLVEDNPGDAVLIQDTLRQATPSEFDVTWVDQLSEAVKRLVGTRFDLVLLDLSLPDSYGLETVIRACEEIPNLPVVVLTGTDDETLGLEALQAGAQDYLIKGRIDYDHLPRALKYALTRYAMNEALNTQATLLEMAHDAILIRDVRSRITFWNRGAETLYGWTKTEALDSVTHSLLQTRFPEPLEVIEARLFSFGQWEGELRHRRRDGREIIVESRQVLMRDATGRAYAILEINRDVTARKEAERQLQTANAELNEVNTQLEHHITRVHDQAVELELQKLELEETNARLRDLATMDGLTGLKNHRAFQERLREEVDRATRYNIPLSVVLMDVDHFKDYNDAFGHPAGDAVLRRIAEVLLSTARSTDLVARYGGEEFVVMLPEADAESARYAAERFRVAIEAIPWRERKVTASFGVATLSLAILSPAALIGQADAALYRAKRHGRNCVTHILDPADKRPLTEEERLRPHFDMIRPKLNLHEDTFVAALETMAEDMRRSYDAMVEGWARLLVLQNREPENHNRRVAELAVRLARAVGMNEEEARTMRWGALLHDIGKLGVPDSILHKPEALTDAEWEVMRRHPIHAYELLAPLAFLRPALDIPRYHHEKWDGTGYPEGLKGDDIPLSARLFAVIDVYDALCSDRPYRKAWSETEALAYLRAQAGVHFDPRAVRAFLQMLGAPPHPNPSPAQISRASRSPNPLS